MANLHLYKEGVKPDERRSARNLSAHRGPTTKPNITDSQPESHDIAQISYRQGTSVPSDSLRNGELFAHKNTEPGHRTWSN